jgi:hypothetical protein
MADGLWLMANDSMVDGTSIGDSATFSAQSTRTGLISPGAILEIGWRLESRIISDRAFWLRCRIVKRCERMWEKVGGGGLGDDVLAQARDRDVDHDQR